MKFQRVSYLTFWLGLLIALFAAAWRARTRRAC